MTKEELTKILELHSKWLNNEEEGKCANLRCADLSNADLSYAHLRGANLRGANLSNADLSNAYLSDTDLRGANLSDANLSNANLRDANLSNADLSNADLSNANLSYVDLRCANLRCANLYGANLSDANLRCANLRCANLYGANLDEKEQCRKGVILKNRILGYKQLQDDVIATLEIPKGAIVFSINNSKCRTNKAKCIALSDNAAIGYSNRNREFTYEINKKYEIEDFNLMYNIECASGIHFFKTLKEAEDYGDV